ncbi:hypothetical protein SORBI_3001G291200 [Sorghum bicolor]|uniref:Uncharacterized protein n=1 Tax=Sorghum bicolor TaxID=4558 RepID=A0A1Z5S859_SORBI|nr:hypothetical protein SORBI_3001G291200 [Sorghum bicolor]
MAARGWRFIYLRSAGEETGVMAKQQQQRQIVCMVFLMAFLVISAMHAVPAEAGRTLADQSSSSVGNEPLKPGVLDPNRPYTRRCRNIYECPHTPDGTATP